MSVTQMQVVKYAFPTIALIIGIWWYKRRRMDRVDPGGIKKRDLKDNNRSNVKSENTNPLISHKNLSDSGIHTDDSLSLNTSIQPISEFVCSPRRVSENLDIPSRKPSSSIPISIRSSRSSNDSQSWYKDVDLTPPDTKEVQLGSNPKISSFDTIVKMRGVPSFETVQENMDVKENEKLENPVEEHENENADSNPQSREIKEQDGENDDSCVKNVEQQPSSCNNSENDNKVGVQLSERDSANHSPISGVLDGSVTDEARSEGSTDSGKGGSINGYAKDNVNNSEILLYEFFVPLHAVGRMIGRNGSGLQAIRMKAGVTISIKRHSSTKDLNTCVIQGSSQGINTALEMIRKKFPEKRYPELTLEQIALSVLPEEYRAPEPTCLMLVAGVNNDVLICHIYKPNRLFVQLPTHPTYPALRILDTTMTQFYETTESPAVPDELQKGMILVAKWYEKWVRVFVECPDPNGERNLVRIVDHGGYWTFSNAEMRKIRADFLILPFQAIEVFLANVKPKNGEWDDEAYNMIAYVCTGVVVQAQIEGYINSNVYVNLYINIQKHGVISMADELVARGFAEPITLEETTPEEELTIL